MKTLKLLSVFALAATLFTSCYTEVIVDDEPGISLNQLLNTHELWYVDINQTLGYGETPFLQIAFTLSFRGGTLYANNNLVGIGSQGGGFGISVGTYNAYNMILDVYHDLDGDATRRKFAGCAGAIGPRPDDGKPRSANSRKKSG